MGQCFQDVGLSELTNIVGKQCPDKMHRTKENFDKWIRDYLEAVSGFLNIGDQLIHWLCTTEKPAFMRMHEFMRCWVQLLSYFHSGYIHLTMELQTAQEKNKQIFFAQPKAHQYKFA